MQNFTAITTTTTTTTTMLFIYECVTFIVCNKNHEEKHTCTDSIYSTMDIQQDGLVSVWYLVV